MALPPPPSDEREVIGYRWTEWLQQVYREVVSGGGGGASALDDLTDVTITSPALNQVLTYNGSVWVNQAPAGGGSLPTGTVTNSLLKWNGSAWVEETDATLTDLGDVEARTFSADDNIIGGFGFQDTSIPSLRGDSSNNHLEFVSITTQIGYMTSGGDFFMDGQGYFESGFAVGPLNREITLNSAGYITRYADSNTWSQGDILEWNSTNFRFEVVTPTGGGGGIGGSIADNQVAVGAATANDIEGSSELTYSGGIFAQNAANPIARFHETDATADQGEWYFPTVNNESLEARIWSDNFLNSYIWMKVERSGTAASIQVDTIDWTAATDFTVSAPLLIVDGALSPEIRVEGAAAGDPKVTLYQDTTEAGVLQFLDTGNELTLINQIGGDFVYTDNLGNNMRLSRDFLRLGGIGRVEIQYPNGEPMIDGLQNGSTRLYEDNQVKLETLSDGVQITGDMRLSDRIEKSAAGEFIIAHVVNGVGNDIALAVESTDTGVLSRAVEAEAITAATGGSRARLLCDGVERLRTQLGGIVITGTINTGFGIDLNGYISAYPGTETEGAYLAWVGANSRFELTPAPSAGGGGDNDVPGFLLMGG